MLFSWSPSEARKESVPFSPDPHVPLCLCCGRSMGAGEGAEDRESVTSLLPDVEFVVLDEVHYLSDISRGTVWEEAVRQDECTAGLRREGGREGGRE